MNTRALGAEVVLYDRDREDREAIGAALAEARGLSLIKPYDAPEVIAGQGTCGLEIAEQAADVGIAEADVLVCCGGGGLTSGIALALEQEAPNMRVRPVEPVDFDDVTRSLQTGHRQSNDRSGGSICDAIVTRSPGEMTFPLMRDLAGRDSSCRKRIACGPSLWPSPGLKLCLNPAGRLHWQPRSTMGTSCRERM